MRIEGGREADLKRREGAEFALELRVKEIQQRYLNHVSRQVSYLPQTTCTPKRFSLNKNL